MRLPFVRPIPWPRLQMVENLSPFIHLHCQKMGPGRRFFDVVTIKGTFVLAPDVLAIADDQPRLELPPDANRDLLARAAMQSPSAAQRAEILERLAGVKSPSFVAALRHNVRSEHPVLREVAERLMAQLFGPAWNRSRPIQPPVQPPPSDEAKGD